MSIPRFRSVGTLLASAILSAFLFHPVAFGGAVWKFDPPPSAPDALGLLPDFGKWDGGFVTYVYNATNAPPGYLDNAEVLGWIQSALEMWQGVCGLTFVSLGVDNAADITNLNDGVVVFQWEDIGGAAGLAGPFSSTPDAVLIEKGFLIFTDGTLRLNPAVFMLDGTESPAEVANNLRSFLDTVLHEVGHLIGLGHSDQPVSRMYANPYNSVTKLRADDIDACRAIYGYPDLTVPIGNYISQLPPQNPGLLDQFDTWHMSAASNMDVPVNSITDLTDDTLGIRWTVIAAGAPFDKIVTVIALDPESQDSVSVDVQIECPQGFGCQGWFSVASFDHLREVPGLWNMWYVIDGETTGQGLNVADLLPALNMAPDARFSFTEQPASRDVSATLDVDGDAEGDTSTLKWHIPTVGPLLDVDIMFYPGSDTENVNLAGPGMHELFLALDDEWPRYQEDPANNVGEAGHGWRRLYRYRSSPRNIGPDHDGDNSSDITFRHVTTGDLLHWRMHGNLALASGIVARLNSLDWRVVSTGDFNGDGKSDLMFRHDTTGEVFYWGMNGLKVVAAASIVLPADTNWRVIGSGDFNGDGKSDLMWRHLVSGIVHLWLMDGPNIIGSAPVAVVDDFQWMVVGDEDGDGDGKADLMWRHGGTGQVYFWQMDGPTILSAEEVAIIADLNWLPVADGDFNGDGHMDLMWRHGVDGKVYYWMMQGGTILFSARVAIVGDLDWTVCGSGDYNGDDLADLLWVHGVTGEMYHWQQFGHVTIRGGQLGFFDPLDWAVVDCN